MKTTTVIWQTNHWEEVKDKPQDEPQDEPQPEPEPEIDFNPT